jgi:CRP-like cAMP-binding protein
MDDLLALIRGLIPLDSDGAATVAALFRPLHLAAGDYFLQRGQVCRYVGFVEKGLLRYYVLEERAEHTYDFSPEGTFVSNYESFLTQTPSVRFIEALEPTVLWRVSYPALQQFYQQVPHGQAFGRLVAEQLFVDTLQKLTSFYRENAQERYDRFEQQFPGLVTRVPQYVIASYVGIKPQSLSRIRAQRAGKRY